MPRIVYIESIELLENIRNTEPTQPAQRIRGDVNADDVFDLTDIIVLQKWIVRVQGTALADWQAGDLCEDGTLNVLDLSTMKRELMRS